MKHFIATAIVLFPTLALAQAWAGQRGNDVPEFKVRSGLIVSLVVKDMEETRFLEMDDKGTLYVSQPKAGKIIALRDKDGDGAYETSATFIEGRKRAHGMHFKDGWLWFSTTGSINKAKDSDGDGKADEVVVVIPDGQLPHDGGHWFRSICVTDDGFYTSIGDNGNMDAPAEPDPKNAKDFNHPDRQKIFFFKHDGSGKKEFATGVRNTEKLRIRPGSNDLYGCDHGSDMFGARFGETGGPGKQPITDHMPPEEFNHYVEGGFYGHPYIVGNRVPRMEWVEKKSKEEIVALAAKTTVPAVCFGAHWAPNGWCFLTKDSALGKKGDALVSFHGSWNSSDKVGYRVERITFDSETNKPYGTQMLVGTLKADGKAHWARPVDCVEADDGSVLFSCDDTKRVYRISAAK